jgi:phenylpyruvate tautomerase PptA (4-oxalocrotonate tautomerase family)
VCFVDANGETLRTVRYASAACDDPRELVSRMTADLSAALKKRTDLTVGIVQDGAPEMWNRTREGLQALRDEGRLETWHEAIDRYHLMERLGEALKIVESNATDEQRKQHLAHWRATCSTPPRTLSIASNSSCDSAATASRTIGIRRLFERIGSTSRTTRTDCDTSRFARPASPSAVASPRAPPRPSSINVPRAPDNAGEKSDSVGVVTLRALDQSQRLPRFWSHLANGYTANVQVAEAA